MWTTDKNYNKVAPIYVKSVSNKTGFLFSTTYQNKLTINDFNFQKTKLHQIKFNKIYPESIFSGVSLTNSLVSIRDSQYEYSLSTLDSLESSKSYYLPDTFQTTSDLLDLYVIKPELNNSLYATVRYYLFNISDFSVLKLFLHNADSIKKITYKETSFSNFNEVTLDFLLTSNINSEAVITLDIEFKILDNFSVLTVINNELTLKTVDILFYNHNQANYFEYKSVSIDNFNYYKTNNLTDLYLHSNYCVITENNVIISE